MREEFGFTRTTCGCRKCQIWCENQPGNLVPSDLERLIPPDADPYEWACIHLRASMGCQCVIGANQVVVIPSLVPAKGEAGACHWYQDGRCQIHQNAPFGCAFLDQHLSEAEAARRSEAARQTRWQAFKRDDLYAKLWGHLCDNGCRYTTSQEDRERVGAIFRQMDLGVAREKLKAAKRKQKLKKRHARKQRHVRKGRPR